MLIFLTLLNTVIFVFLSLMHIYWAFGGQMGKDAAVPTIDSGEKLFIPSSFGTLIVAAGLLVFALINLFAYVISAGFINIQYIRYGILGVGFVFLLRATGDFNYVGLMKKHKDTVFAKMDTRFYAPLCLSLFLSHLLIFITITS
ncbi:DUF3995 domain-containing protein [Pedobacter cryoconitis]|uniref:DUF3995 domain-containing protein n=1 Tax=Pedobacter cryoconitis TaxID=188932 RepID=A0A7X0J1E3_9SPHI|nr:DUF3995 domain-containing protein [Pedobacter cryoconitis]MBB6499258.1 hypothetical protein [Pedobacter cryoconitis]